MNWVTVFESVYREDMVFAPQQKSLQAEREKKVEVSFRAAVVGIFRTDVVVSDTVHRFGA